MYQFAVCEKTVISVNASLCISVLRITAVLMGGCFLCVKAFGLNASVFQVSVRNSFSALSFLCARDFSLAARPCNVQKS